MRIFAVIHPADCSGIDDGCVGGLRRFDRPCVVAGSIDDDDLRFLQFGDIRRRWLVIMRIHIGGIDDAGYVDVATAQGFRHGTPLIHGSDHFDGSVFFGRRSAASTRSNRRKHSYRSKCGNRNSHNTVHDRSSLT